MDKRGLATAIFIFISSFTLQAQEVLAPTDITAAPLDVIGGRRTTQPTENVPQSQLKTEERPQLSDALNTLPGVQSRLNGSPLLSIRGSQSSARTLVLEDGVPLDFSDGVGFNPLYVATENLAGLTLLRGPSSTLFGHDSLAGVLEFYTEDLPSPKVYASDGSFGTTQIFAGMPLRFAVPNHDLTAQATVYQTHTDGNFPFSMPRIGLGGVRQGNDQETLRATVQAQDLSHENFQWKTFNLFARQIGSTPGIVTSPSALAFNNWGELSGLSVSSKLSEKYAVGSRTSFKYLSQSYSGSATGLTSGVREGLSATDKISDKQIEIFDDYDFEKFTAAYLPSNSQSITINEGGLSGLTPLSETTILSAAIRFSTENNGLTPSVGLEGQAPGDWKYFLNYSEGYHPASVTQKYARFPGFGGTPGFSGNPGLNSEHSFEVDLGFEKRYTNFDTHFEAFQRTISDLIENQVLVAGTETPENVGTARANGFEIWGQSDIPSIGLEWGAGVDYLQNTQTDTGTPVPLSPQVQATLSAREKILKGSVTLQDTYWSNYYDTDFSVANGSPVLLNGWNTVDFFAEYPLYKKTLLKVSVLNVFNQPRELTLGYPEPQRSLTVLLESYL